MNTDKIKKDINSLKGKNVKIKVNIGRNKYEYYEGIIIETYPFLFTIKAGGLVKSFSYADVLTKDVQLKVSNT